MTTYSIRHTDLNKPPKLVDEGAVNDTALDIALFGRVRLEYGELLNQNLLNLLENFAAPMSIDTAPAAPPVTDIATPTPAELF